MSSKSWFGSDSLLFQNTFFLFTVWTWNGSRLCCGMFGICLGIPTRLPGSEERYNPKIELMDINLDLSQMYPDINKWQLHTMWLLLKWMNEWMSEYISMSVCQGLALHQGEVGALAQSEISVGPVKTSCILFWYPKKIFINGFFSMPTLYLSSPPFSPRRQKVLAWST